MKVPITVEEASIDNLLKRAAELSWRPYEDKEDGRRFNSLLEGKFIIVDKSKSQEYMDIYVSETESLEDFVKRLNTKTK